ncbi:MAG: N-6 DNA methylase [Candidatus Cloacimonetes bacterium]|nr:N-6 DNA methylase [Candidatus Cloacimonadota bacterium]
MLKEYLNALQVTFNRGDAREESYYSQLEKLILTYAGIYNIKNVDITVLPKQTEAGNPDFRVWDGKNHITGYIEAKAPTNINLDAIQYSEQLKRYCSTFPNVILTNFYEFRLFRDGQLIDTVQIGRPEIAQRLKTAPPPEHEEEFMKFMQTFFSFSLPKVHTAKTLAQELAKRTRFLRDEVISIDLKEKEGKGNKDILGFYEAFKKYLIGTLTHKQFADLYSQTITYGLFAARTRTGKDFNRQLAYQYIPHTIGILRDVFRFISLQDPPIELKVIVDDISEVLRVTDVKSILRRFFHEGKGKDPIIHFYETFLSEYDPKIRERRGVYYTPEPVVQYITNSLHQILKKEFDLSDGFASENVTVLDPAAGTLTFPAEAIKIAVHEFEEKYGRGGLHSFIKDNILKNFYAFELMMAPYAIGHLKMGFLLEELGYKMTDDERFKLYLTNTLEMEELDSVNIPGLSSLSEENHLANEVKQQIPILVIMGNPPYSGISSNTNEWTEKLLKTDIDGAQSYYVVDGKPLGERNPKWLQDDYVKFLRFAQWKIQKAGHGVIGMITNHSYLDNPTFRGMRQSLMKTFNKIFILNLHGNSLKKETAPDGSKDENVFDIRQGVAICFMIKHHDQKGCEVFYHNLYGERNSKYEWFEQDKVEPYKYDEILPKSPYYFFIERHTQNIQHYLLWKKISEIFPVNSVGIVTARDSFVVSFSKNELIHRLNQFRNLSLDDEIIEKAYKLKSKKHWNLSIIRNKLSKEQNLGDCIQNIAYRPFDERYIAYNQYLIERERFEIMHNMLDGDNIGICTVRQVKVGAIWSHILVSDKIIESCYISNKTSEIGYIFSLFTYSKNDDVHLFEKPQVERKPNIAPEIFRMLRTAYGKEPSPEEILYYIYGIFYSNVYREKYAEFLKIDFPRVPFTADFELFRKVGALGKQLVQLHLLESKELDTLIAKYQGTGENDRIEKVVYNEDEQRVYINDGKYFEGINSELWSYHIGGYQVLYKYLKDRKGRILEDARRYCKIATALQKTIELQKEIDLIYLQVEENILE